METRKRVLKGQVVSTKMQNTIVVKVERVKKRPLYKKQVRIFRKFKAHDQDQKACVGDTVTIVESRPFSKDKHFKLQKVFEKKS